MLLFILTTLAFADPTTATKEGPEIDAIDIRCSGGIWTSEASMSTTVGEIETRWLTSSGVVGVAAETGTDCATSQHSAPCDTALWVEVRAYTSAPFPSTCAHASSPGHSPPSGCRRASPGGGC